MNGATFLEQKKLASLEATLVQNYNPLTHLTYRATSIAKTKQTKAAIITWLCVPTYPDVLV